MKINKYMDLILISSYILSIYSHDRLDKSHFGLLRFPFHSFTAYNRPTLIHKDDLIIDSNLYFILGLYDDDDEVRRVCKTPGDPCGCTRQYY